MCMCVFNGRKGLTKAKVPMSHAAALVQKGLLNHQEQGMLGTHRCLAVAEKLFGGVILFQLWGPRFRTCHSTATQTVSLRLSSPALTISRSAQEMGSPAEQSMTCPHHVRPRKGAKHTLTGRKNPSYELERRQGLEPERLRAKLGHAV